MKILCLGFISLLLLNTAFSQLQIKLSISRIDSLQHVDTAYFGVDPRATYCIDTSLGEQLIWWQACGLVPCLAFIDVRTGPGACLDWGIDLDLRPYYSPTQIDTYRLKFDGYTPVVFHWPGNISDYYGAMILMNNRDSNAATVKVNMLTQDSFVLNDELYYQKPWFIYAEFPHLTSVSTNEIDLPAEAHLFQNYPNPFNPSTSIVFILPHEALVNISVYDLLGREVRLLVHNQRFSIGTHRINFTASGLSSGVYFCRLVATDSRSGLQEFTDIKKMAICQ
jgi:hypothetical protein